jgi:predicted nucleic acid-binding protein
LHFDRQIDGKRGWRALEDYQRLRIRRYPHKPLLSRVWELRGNFTTFDALYVALAKSLGATLLTCDGKLASAPGHRAKIELV